MITIKLLQFVGGCMGGVFSACLWALWFLHHESKLCTQCSPACERRRCATHMAACWASLKSFFFFIQSSSLCLFLCKSSQANHAGLVSAWFGSLANCSHCFPAEARSSTLDSKRSFDHKETGTTISKKKKMFWLALSFHFHNREIHLQPPSVCIGSTAISSERNWHPPSPLSALQDLLGGVLWLLQMATYVF